MGSRLRTVSWVLLAIVGVLVAVASLGSATLAWIQGMIFLCFAPLAQILRDLHDNGSHPVLSLELFSPKYWEKDPLEVAKTGLAKMKSAVEKALGAA